MKNHLGFQRTAGLVSLCGALWASPALAQSGTDGTAVCAWERQYGIGRLQGAVWSPNASAVATFGARGAWLWSASNGAPLLTFEGAPEWVNAAAFSGDGTRLATCGDDGSAKLWSVAGGTLLRTFRGHAGTAWGVAISPDGTQLATASEDGTAKLWSVADGTVLRTFTGHTGAVWSVAFSPDGTRILTGGADGTAKVWSTAGGQLLFTCAGHSQEVSSVAFSPDGAWLLSGGWEGAAILWNATNGALVRAFSGHRDSVTSVAFSPDGAKVLTGSWDGTARSWRADTAAALQVFFGHSNAVLSAAFDYTGNQVLTAGDDNTVRIWSASDAQTALTIRQHTHGVWGVAISPDRTKVLTASWDKTAVLWDRDTGAVLRTFRGHADDVLSVAFSPDGSKVLTGSWDKTAKLWSAADGSLVRTFSGHTEGVYSVAFAPDGRTVLSGSADNTARLWSTNDGSVLKVFLGHSNDVMSVVFAPDGRTLLTGSADATAKLWSTNGGAAVRTFAGHTHYVRSVAFSADGSRILTGGWDGLARLWPTNGSTWERTFAGHSSGIWSVAFSPDGLQVLTGGSDQSARLWSTEDGALLRTFLGHTYQVSGVAFASDGSWILTGSWDGSALLWNPARNPEITILTASPLSQASMGVPYAASFQALGGTAPYSWSVISGSLPAGLNLSPGGALSGTPTSDGTNLFTARVTDAGDLWATKAYRLEVLPATVSILTQPRSVSVVAGNPASFSVVATGATPLFYQWLLNGVPLSGRTASTLTLAAVQPGDGGSYQVVVSNRFGAKLSQEAILTVNSNDQQPPVLSQVAAVPGLTTCDITWLTDEPATGVVEYGPTAALGLTNVSPAYLTTNHLVVLSSLNPGTTYYFRPRSADEPGNSAYAGTTNFSFTTTPAADLVPTNLTATGSPALQAGAQVTIQWQDLNRGGLTVNAGFQERLQVRNQTTSQTLVDTYQTYDPYVAGNGAIAPGTAATRSYVFTLPSGASGAGSLQITVTVDAANSVFEYNPAGTGESNNSLQIAAVASLPPYPDLAVTNVAGPATGLPGQSFPVTWTVRNAGNAPVSGSWSESVFLVDAAGQSELLQTFVFTNTLAAGGSVVRTQSVTVPVYVGGTRWLGVQADSALGITEANETNNYAQAAATTVITPALTLNLSLSALTESAGTNALTVRITRNGVVTNALTVSIDHSLAPRLAFPDSVVIPTGATFVEITTGTTRDGLVTGDQTQSFTVAAVGFAGAQGQIPVLDEDLPTLALALSTNWVLEGASTPAATGVVTRNTATNQALVVTLLSDQPSRAAVPSSVTIAAGQRSAKFQVSVADNDLLDGDVQVGLSAVAGGFLSAGARIEVADNDFQALTLSLSVTSIVEGASSPAAIGRLTRQVVTAAPLVAELSSGSPGVISVPAQLVIPAGLPYVDFPIHSIDNQTVDGPRNVAIQARLVAGGTPIDSVSAIAVLQVVDNDGPTLALAVERSVLIEGSSAQAVVSRNTSTATNLVVNLASSLTSRATLPAAVTIPAGQVSVTFTVVAVNDGLQNGSQAVSLTASAAGFNSGLASITISDVTLPDLRVSSIAAGTNGICERAFPVSWTVVNSGSAAAAGSWIDKVYLSADPQLGDDVLLGSATYNGTLETGASYTQSRTLTLPQKTGTFWILVVAAREGNLAEASTNNNSLASTLSVAIHPPYLATVQTEVTVATNGSPIPLHGSATDALTGQAATGVPVSIHVIVQKNGTPLQRILTATTDTNGSYSTVFRPLAYEAGHYWVWAAHPAVETGAAQDSFDLVGLRATPSSVSLRLVPGVLTNTVVQVQNLSDLPVTNLEAQWSGNTNNLGITLDLTNALGAAETGALLLGFNTTVTNRAHRHLELRMASPQGVAATLPIELDILPLNPLLAANPAYLENGMVVGEQTLVEFELSNTGGSASGDLQVLLPQVSWLSLASPATLASLAPGAKTKVTLQLTPPAGLSLGRYEGSLMIWNGQTQLSVPFRFRALSSRTGELMVTVVDDYTFMVAGEPKVTNAAVRLRDPYDTSVIVAQTRTDTNGLAYLPAIAEGTYYLEVEADHHAVSRNPWKVRAGVTNQVQVFLPRQLVTFRWRVVPVEIPDQYRLTLEPVFEANVPVPVITIEVPKILPALAPGEHAQVDVQLINHGLIAAQDVQLLLPELAGYHLTALSTNLGAIPALSTNTVPVVLSRDAKASPAKGAKQAGCVIDCIRALYFYTCGYIPRRYQMAAADIYIPDYSCIDAVLAIFPGPSSPGGPEDWERQDEIDIQNAALLSMGFGLIGFWGPPGLEVPLGSCDLVDLDLIDLDDEGKTAAAASRSKDSSSEPGVCAKVRLRIDQDAVLTRTVFRGILEMENTSAVGPLTKLALSLDIRNESGAIALDKFTILGPEVQGLTAVDGNGTLAANAAGTAQFTFIPNRTAAPALPTTYLIGGTLAYTDPETGQSVVWTLIPDVITVYPDASLVLHYFQQRDVFADDPHTPELEPSEPFSLGVLVQNRGAGRARKFSITSAEPKIVDNEKGLAIQFSLLGTQVGAESVTPSFTADFGDIDPGQAKVGRWLMSSTLQGKFIEYSVTFQHLDALGGKHTSLIESAEVHELIHVVRADRTNDDNLMDFLVNDVADADNLPDTLYLSDGTVALVSPITNAVVDHLVDATHRQVHLSMGAAAGWTYLKTADPGPGWVLYRVVRQDGKELRVGDNCWTTDRSFPSALTGARRENALHLFDFDSPGGYTLYYRAQNTGAPALVEIQVPESTGTALAALDVLFSKAMDPATFDYHALTLTRNGGTNLVNASVTVSQTASNVFQVGGLAALTGLDGNYTITVNGAGILDLAGVACTNNLSARWAKGTVAPAIAAIEGAPLGSTNHAIDTLDLLFTKAIDPASLTRSCLSLTRDGGAELISSGIQLVPMSTNRFRVVNLAALTAAPGSYVFTASAATVTDLDGVTGAGSLSVVWDVVVSGPQISYLETPSPSVRLTPVPALEVRLTDRVFPQTLNYRSLFLTRDGGANLVTSQVRFSALSDTRFRITGLESLTASEGVYRFSMTGTNLMDLAGNKGSGEKTTSWMVDLTAPAPPAGLAIRPDTGASTNDSIVNTGNLILSGQLGETNLTVNVRDETSVGALAATNVLSSQFSVPITILSSGTHRLSVTATDAAGNTSPKTYLYVFVDFTRPAATLVAVSPNPRATPVSEIEVGFTEPIDAATFTSACLLLTRNKGANLATAQLQVRPSAANRFVVANLAGLNQAPGSYELTVLTTNIADVAGNPGVDPASATWRLASTNSPPSLAPILDRTANPNELLILTNFATDPDLPDQKLTFSLGDAPAGGFIDPATGILTWVPTKTQLATTNLLTVVVTDNGVPQLSDQKTFRVIVQAPASAPAISVQPLSLALGDGDPLQLVVAATGTQPITYQWEYNGAPIPAATNATLSITGMHPQQSGGYRAVARNAYGMDVSALAVVTVAPTNSFGSAAVYDNSTNFLGAFWSGNSEFGDEVLLAPSRYGWVITGMELGYFVSANASGNETMRVRIYDNDGPELAGLPGVLAPGTVLYDTVTGLPLARGYQSLRLTNLNVLAIERLTFSVQFGGVTGTEQAGLLLFDPPEVGESYDDYWLRSGEAWGLEQVPGSVANFAARLTGFPAKGRAPLIAAQPQSQEAFFGESAVLTVIATAFPNPSYQWRHNGTNLIDGAGVSGVTNPVLAFAGIQSTNAGDYDVLIWNASGVVTSQVASVTVKSRAAQQVFRLRIAGQSEAHPGLILDAETGLRVSLQASSNLVTWTDSCQLTANVLVDLEQIDPLWFSHSQFFRGLLNSSQTDSPPSILEAPASLTVRAGQPALFRVRAGGSAPFSYQWRRGTLSLANTGNVFGATSPTLTLSGAQAADEGAYTVVITNSAGAITSAVASLTVQVPPTITLPPLSRTNVAGSTATFSVAASGTTPFAYQWRKGGVNLADGGNVSGASATTLTLANVQSTDDADYTVVVSNVAGAVTSVVARLTVQVPPTISLQPQSRTNLAGSTATFNVAATGTTPFAYQWRKGAINLASGGNVSGASAATLTLANVQPIDEADYTVVVSNVAGAVTSVVAQLTVRVPPTFTVQPQNQTNVAGASAAFSVVVAGTAPFSYQWRKSGVNLADGGNVSGATSSALSLANIQPADQAGYEVVVANVAGAATSSVATLTVLVPPTITTHPQDQRVPLGATVLFNVSASGSTPFAYQWRKDSTNLAGATASFYSITNVQTAHAGNYSVLVTNAAGSAVSSNALLAVGTPPTITTQPKDQLVVTGMTFSLTVTAGGDSPFGYQWRHAGTNLVNSSRVSGAMLSGLTVSNVQPSDLGAYTVVVTNLSGAITSQVATVALYSPTNFAWAPPGTFVMGSADDEQDRWYWEGPQTTVTLTRGFFIAKRLVTQGDYQGLLGVNPSYFTGNTNRPVESVTWYDATNFCGKLTQRESLAGRIPAGFAFRLPTEAEWEYACRAGTTNRFSFGDDPTYTLLSQYAWFADNSGSTTQPVGLKLPNPWGLYDIHGNVAEWCSDWHTTFYSGGSVTNPAGPATGTTRQIRGGDWSVDGSWLRSASRNDAYPDARLTTTGFRVVLAPAP